jgi:thiamine biosynthesis lipoprotein
VAKKNRQTEITEAGDFFRCKFIAMGSPCEILVETGEEELACRVADAASAEAWRIEDKFSRYLPGNIVDRINHAGGEAVKVDDETARLIDFAATLHEVSAGKFDITSGILREVWTFDGSDRVPAANDVAAILERVGWSKVRWDNPLLTLGPGMQIDLGGIAKEYAVDRTASLIAARSSEACLVNFGGDLAALKPPLQSGAWQVGIEALNAERQMAQKRIRLEHGGLATSGDARRFLLQDGIRYSHILDPTTGWPVRDAPRSITVAADTCTQAGMLATLAMLNGPDAEHFLEAQAVRFWCYR